MRGSLDAVYDVTVVYEGTYRQEEGRRARTVALIGELLMMRARRAAISYSLEPTHLRTSRGRLMPSLAGFHVTRSYLFTKIVYFVEVREIVS